MRKARRKEVVSWSSGCIPAWSEFIERLLALEVEYEDLDIEIKRDGGDYYDDIELVVYGRKKKLEE